MEPYIIAGITAVFTGGVSLGGFRYFMNGTKQRLAKLEQLPERLARVETKIDILLERK